MMHNLNPIHKLSGIAQNQGIESWADLIQYVRKLPYGRTSNRSDLSLVFSEQQGTCSSKHALLKAVANENKIADVRLILCIYKMNKINTPGIGNALSKHKISYIPEAHCYLQIGPKKLDCTSTEADLDRIKMDILEEIEITPEQVGQFKIDYHQAYLKGWLKREKLDLSFAEIWAIREQCIANLSI